MRNNYKEPSSLLFVIKVSLLYSVVVNRPNFYWEQGSGQTAPAIQSNHYMVTAHTHKDSMQPSAKALYTPGAATY